MPDIGIVVKNGNSATAGDVRTGQQSLWATSRSGTYRRAIEEMQLLARSRTAPILLEGESGTGKTVLARAIHDWSPRSAEAFCAIVLSTLDDSLAGSALFGHTVGAYTDARHARSGGFASGHGGTVFLDELAKGSRAVQEKLLHVVETGEFQPIGSDRTIHVDVRVVAATNANLDQLVDQGQFLPDLFARLAAFRVRIPALRERRQDIPELVRNFTRLHAADCGYAHPPDVSPDLMQALTRAAWPYNLRQLSSTIQRLMLRAHGADPLSLELCQGVFDELMDLGAPPPLLTPDVAAAAVAQHGSVIKAARHLGVDRTTVYRHLRLQQGNARR